MKKQPQPFQSVPSIIKQAEWERKAQNKTESYLLNPVGYVVKDTTGQTIGTQTLEQVGQWEAQQKKPADTKEEKTMNKPTPKPETPEPGAKRWKDVYLNDYSKEDFKKAKYVKKQCAVIKAISPEDTQSHSLTSTASHNKMTSIWFEVVYLAPGKPEEMSLEVGDVVSVNIAAVDPLTEKAEFAVVPYEDIYFVWDAEDLKVAEVSE